jgi:hypothetical protein
MFAIRELEQLTGKDDVSPTCVDAKSGRQKKQNGRHHR